VMGSMVIVEGGGVRFVWMLNVLSRGANGCICTKWQGKGSGLKMLREETSAKVCLSAKLKVEDPGC